MNIFLNPRATPTSGTPAPLNAEAPSTRPTVNRPALTISEALSSEADAVEAVPADALRRDDDLGRLFSAAFNLPPPPMPSFSS